ncbi:MAG TPA: branched-chain amino acid aminotransferase [Syntrophobacteraceae bacterium]|nr:branched-chain amino acid aminotransferase [Syntrophobacteraceae bacterium]
MEIKVQPIDPARRNAKPADESKLVFGKTFSDHMFMMDYESGVGWRDARIVPYQDLCLDPAAMVLHYGQGIFEGMKGYRCRDGKIRLFRPQKNFERFNRSAFRVCMPEIPTETQFEILEALLKLDKDWIPHSVGSSLYIRPTMIATEAALGVRPAKEYLYYIITGPVAAYYAEGFNPVKIYVTDEFIRTVRGGVGEAKTMANYAASLFAAEMAKRKGFTQVLWLDGVERRFVEEVGTMNIFFRIRDELITPPLSGSILPGVTRDSVIQLARHWGIQVTERLIDIDEVMDAVQSGDMKEIFGTGTAAVISPVGEVFYRDQRLRVGNGGVGQWSQKLYDEIVGIQYGEREDPFGWTYQMNI